MKCVNCKHKLHRTEYGEWYHEAKHHNYCDCNIAKVQYNTNTEEKK